MSFVKYVPCKKRRSSKTARCTELSGRLVWGVSGKHNVIQIKDIIWNLFIYFLDLGSVINYYKGKEGSSLKVYKGPHWACGRGYSFYKRLVKLIRFWCFSHFKFRHLICVDIRPQTSTHLNISPLLFVLLLRNQRK